MQEKFVKPAKIAIEDCLAVRPDERLLVVTDTRLADIGQALFEAGIERAAGAAMVVITPRKSHGEEPPDAIAELMLRYDALAIPTYRSMTHTEARRNACKLGARCITLPGILGETMVRAVDADYNRIAALSEGLAERLTQAKWARVTTPAGTDIGFSLDGRDGLADKGLVHEPGEYSNLPAGEAYIGPIEETASGVFVIDGAVADTGVLAGDDKISVRVEGGFAVEVTGGRSAEYLESLLRPHGKDALNVAELGIGTNYEARLIGNILEDEKVLGTVHIALGDNKSMGGHINVASHLDGILLRPTLYLDDEMLMSGGELLVS